MIPTELFDKTVLHQTYLLRRSNGITRDVVKLLIEAERDIKAQLINTDLTKYQDARLKNLLADVQKRISTVTADISKTILPEFNQLAIYEAGHQAATLGSVVTVPIEVAATTTLIASVTESPIQGKFFGEWMSTLEASTVSRLNQSIRIGVLEGETLNQMSARIRADFKTTRNAAEQLVRTGTNSVTNNARQILWAQNSDIVEKWEFVATLDYRTTLECQKLDGEKFDIGEGPRPPRHRNCYHKDTSILTDKGFVLVKDAKVGDMCWTINQQTENMELSPVIDTVKNYEKTINNIKTKTVNMSVSKNHPFVGQKRVDHGSYRCYEPCLIDDVNKLPDGFRVYASSKWIGKDVDTVNINGLDIDAVAFVKFMAVYLSDGSYTEGKNYISIARTRTQGVIFDILNELPCEVSAWGQKIAIKSPQLIEYVKQFGKCDRKFVPSIIKDMSAELLNHFIDVYLICDGHIQKGKMWDGYECRSLKKLFTTSKQLADDLSEIIIKAGHSVKVSTVKAGNVAVKKDGSEIVSRLDLYLISINDTPYRNINKKDVVEVEYNDYVYDVEVEKNNTLLTEYQGFILWGSNCRSTTVAVVKEPLFNATTRSSLQGQVDAKITYPQWLKTQPAAAQKEVLGPARYKLWKDGRLKIDQFTDKTGRTLTLDELKVGNVVRLV